MKRLLALIFSLHTGFALAQSPAWAEVEKSVVCGPLQNVISVLAEEFKEYPIFLGTDGKDNSTYSLFVNQDTGGWTIIQFNKTTACILGTGSNGRVVSLDRPTI